MDSPDVPRTPQRGTVVEEPVLILTPTGRDAAVAMAWLHAAGIRTHRCRDVAELCAAMDTAAAALLADEALPAQALDVLCPALQRQPVWSDFPVLLLTSSPRATEAMWQRVQALGAVGNITVLERPLTPVTVLSTLQVALRSRRRQHELRALHAAQQRHLAKQAALLAQLQARDQALQDLNATLEQQITARTAALRHEMAERQRLEREAQRVQHFALLGQLAAGVSHEIRNPLGAVFLHVDLLAEELQQPTPDSPAVVAEALAEIKTNLARLDDLVQDYLTLVRVGSIQRTPEDLGGAVQAWGAEFQTLAAPQGVRLHLRASPTWGPWPCMWRRCAARCSTWCRTRWRPCPREGCSPSPGGARPRTLCSRSGTPGAASPARTAPRSSSPCTRASPGGPAWGCTSCRKSWRRTGVR